MLISLCLHAHRKFTGYAQGLIQHFNKTIQSMGRIKSLDPEVVQHIAAGEVIERPASIVKELIENALDASATRIEVEIDGGGIERIQVSDNGIGMDEVDAALSLQRHATSKIHALSDLEKIKTYGFRGEALASIAAVSKFEILTHHLEALDGTKIVAEGGVIQQIGPVGCPQGARVIVKDLFFNVPARRKFLKSVQTEDSACLDIIGKMALARSDVAFLVKKNGKLVLTLQVGESLQDRYLSLFPQTEESQLHLFEAARDSMQVKGILGAPLFSKSSRSSILLYVNHRFVRPGVLSQAVVDGYSGYLEAGKFPIAVLFFEIDGKWVDVNAHPTKAEVRFSHPKDIYAFIEKAVALRLEELQEKVRPHLVPYYVPENYSSSTPSRHEAKYEDLTLFEKMAPYAVEEKKTVLLGSVAKTYALFQEGDTLFLVDLHVAHERINFDLLESRYQSEERPAQELLSPILIELSADQQGLVREYGEFLRRMGLEWEEFGTGSIRVRGVPAGLEKLGQKPSILSLLEQLTKVDETKGPEDKDRKILATMACRSSVQAGDEVETVEMQSLFERLLRSSNPYFCPHGRPIIIKLTLDEVHRLFRRKWSL